MFTHVKVSDVVKVQQGLPVSPVAQFLRQVDVQDVRQDGGELRGVAQSGTDGVSRVDVVQLCTDHRSALKT